MLAGLTWQKPWSWEFAMDLKGISTETLKNLIFPSIKELKDLCKWTVDFFSKMANKQI